MKKPRNLKNKTFANRKPKTEKQKQRIPKTLERQFLNKIRKNIKKTYPDIAAKARLGEIARVDHTPFVPNTPAVYENKSAPSYKLAEGEYPSNEKMDEHIQNRMTTDPAPSTIIEGLISDISKYYNPSDPEKFYTEYKPKLYHGSDLSGFKNYIDVNRKYLPEFTEARLSALPKLTIVKSACGTGKNFTLTNLIIKYLSSGKRVVILTPRRALARTLALVYAISCYLSSKGQIDGSVVICLDSIQRVSTNIKDIDLLILDEAAQLAVHSMGGTIRSQKNVDGIHTWMQYLMTHSKKIIAQDADFDSETVRHVQMWAKHCDYAIIHNKAIPFKPKTHLYSNDAHFWKKIILAVKQGYKPWVSCSSAKMAKKLAEKFRRVFPNKVEIILNEETKKKGKIVKPSNVLEVHQRVVGEEAVGNCIENPDLFNQYDAVFASPSIQTGISVEHENTWMVFGYIQGLYKNGPSINDAYQSINRVRKPVNNEWHVFIKGSTHTSDKDLYQILDTKREFNNETKAILYGFNYTPCGDSGNQKVDIANKELIIRVSDLEVRANRYGGEYKNYYIDDEKNKGFGTWVKGAFYRLWEEKGFEIIEVESDDNLEPLDLSEISNKIEEKEIKEIIKSDIITKEEADELAKLNRTAISDAQIELCRIREFYNLKNDELPSEHQVRSFRHQGRMQMMQYGYVTVFNQNHGKEVAAIDARSIKCPIHCNHVYLKTQEIVNFFATTTIDFKDTIKRIENGESFESIQKLQKPLEPIIFTDTQKKRFADLFDMRIKTGVYTNIVRSILGKMGLTLKRGKQVDGKFQYSLDIERFKQLWVLTKAFRHKLIHPEEQLELIKDEKAKVEKKKKQEFVKNNFDLWDVGDENNRYDEIEKQRDHGNGDYPEFNESDIPENEFNCTDLEAAMAKTQPDFFF